MRPRRFPLRLKIAAFAAALVAVAMGAVVVATVIVPWKDKLAAQDRVATDLVRTAVPLSVEARKDGVRLDASKLRLVVVNSLGGVPVVYALVFDEKGNLDPGASSVNAQLLQHISEPLTRLCFSDRPRCLGLLANGKRQRGIRSISMKLALPDGKGAVARLELGISTLLLDADLRRSLLRNAVVLAATLLLALLGAVGMGGRIAKPLSQLSWAMGRLEKGDYNQHISLATQSQDEVGDLARAFNAMAGGLIERERLRGTLGRYVSDPVAERILSEHSDLAIAGELRHVTVLFLDVRGFTTVSELLGPPEVLELLNEYFTVVVDRVTANGGTVNKFIGDAAMCIWGAPRESEAPERSAVICALEIQAAGAHLSEDRLRRKLTSVGFGIGINSGEAIAGNLGASRRLEYTVIGDAVNLAQRLESQARPGEILVSKSIHDKVADLVEADEREPVKLKGKAQAVQLWEVRRLKAASTEAA